MPFYTYILKSLKDDGYYYGHTSDIENRLLKHNGKKFEVQNPEFHL
jgi:predicted GIY-YIG superfamily endonuclease